MEADAPHIIPSIYLANYLNQFEEKIRRYDVQEMRLKKGEYLTKYGVINNTAYFIKSGIIHLSLGHDQGRKSLNLFGPGTVFPIGVEIHEYRVEYEMILQALTDIEVYRMSYPTLKKIMQENGDFAGELLRENCDFIGYMFFDTINQAFEPCLARICDILYLYLSKVHPSGSRIPLTQAELANIAGTSQAQMERSIRLLKNEGILDTSRKQIIIIDQEKLLAYCTLGMRSNVEEENHHMMGKKC